MTPYVLTAEATSEPGVSREQSAASPTDRRHNKGSAMLAIAAARAGLDKF
jgi:hypothetical protein